MRISHAVLLAGVVSTPAQAQNNPYVVFPQDPERQAITSASFVRRPDWNNAAEGLIELNGDLFRGVGDENTASMVHGYYHWAADENITTPETYSLVMRLADVTGIPNNTAAGLIVNVGPLMTPARPGGPRASTIMRDVFATPVQVPSTQTWFHGIDFPANPLWPLPAPQGDGHSLWAADRPTTSNATNGSNPRMGAPDVCWSVSPTGTIVTRGWTCIQGPLVIMPVLHVGGIDPANNRVNPAQPPGLPGYGLDGLYPDISGNPRSDGINLRITDNAAPGGIVLVGGSAAWSPVPIPITHQGRVHIDLGSIIPIGFGTLSGGAVEIPVATPGTLSPSLQGLLFRFQGLLFDPLAGPTGRLTNAQSTSL